MTEFELILIALAICGAAIGFARGLRPLDWEMLWLIGVPPFSTLICFLIGSNKTGPEMAGIVGMIAGVFLMFVTSGLLLGGVIGIILRRWRGWTLPPARSWRNWLDRIFVYGLSALGVLLSLLE